MSLPSPQVPFGGQCSAIYNNTLYSYQWNAFQSLPLQEGGKWSQLPMGVAVNGSSCVLGKWDNNDALIIVGGTTNDPAQATYPGLQHFTFSTNTWASTPPGASVTQNRQYHSATYLNSSNSILVYSGFQDDSFIDSSETFTISTQAPYVMQSFPAASPPGTSPILLPWNASHAVMAGGSEGNKNVWVFSEATGWQELSVALPDSVKNMSAVQGAILQGDSDAKALQLFDMSTSPNTVSTLLVQAGDDQPMSKSFQPPRVISQKRDVDFSNWPSYNASLAPSIQRSGFSLAQSSSGIVVISGGTQNTTDPLCMFNQTGNSWISARQFFSGQTPIGNTPSSNMQTSSPSATISFPTASSAAPTSTPTTTQQPITVDNSRTILGAVLGGLAGLAAILIILLLLLRYRKQKQKALNQQNGFPSETKHQMGFDDSAAVAGFGKKQNFEAPKSPPRGIYSSAEGKLGATISNPRLISDSSSPTRGLEIPFAEKPGQLPKTVPDSEGRDDGWSQYFAKSNSNTALDPNSLGANLRSNSASRQTQYTVSNYDVESHTASIYQENDTTPLNPRLSGYPQSEQSWERSKFHPQSTISANYRPGTAISNVSEEEPESFLDPASSSSGTQAWDPVGATDGKSQFNRRPASSMYADSINFPHPGDKVYIPGVSDTSTSNNKSSINNSWRQPSDPRGMRTMITKDLMGGGASSTRPERSPIQEDMSWLNLGK
jgi:hypothetical protein